MEIKRIVVSNKAQRTILMLSLVYLIVPYVIFYIGWLKPQYSLTLCTVFLTALILIWKEIKRVVFSPVEIAISHLCTIAIFVLIILVVTGMGALCGIQAGDWIRNNAILSDLYNKNWPVIYTGKTNEIYPLNYYIAFYLPAAWVGKLVHSFRVAELALLVTTYVGFLLGIFWMIKVVCANAIKSALFFFVYSGLDCLGFIITTGRLFGMTEHLDHWAIQANGQDFIANYHSIGTAIRWSLNHYIATWISLFIILTLIRKKEYKLCLPLAALTLLWSPLAAIGFIPFGIVFLFYERCNVCKFFSLSGMLVTISIAVPCGLYFLSSASPKSGRANIFRDPQWFVENWVTICLFIILEFGIWCFLIARSSELLSTMDKLLLWTAFISLTAFLVVDYGLCHDFSMRASIVPMYVIFSFLPNAVFKSKGTIKQLFYLVLLLSLISTSTEYVTALYGVNYNPVTCSRALLEVNTIEGWALDYQYTGMMSGPFFEKMCKKNLSTDSPGKEGISAIQLTDSRYVGGIAQRNSYVDILVYAESIASAKDLCSLITESGIEVLVSDIQQVQSVFYKISIKTDDCTNCKEFQYPHKFYAVYFSANQVRPISLTDENWTNGVSNYDNIILFSYEKALFEQLVSAKSLCTKNGINGEILTVENVNDEYIHVQIDSQFDKSEFGYPSIISIQS